MIPFLFHPSRQRLAAFEVGDQSADHGRVARHLERCAECRQYVGFARRFARAVSTLPAAVPDEGLLSRALADRAAGGRTILPASGPIAPASNTLLRRALGVAALFIVVALAAIWQSDRASRADFGATELLLTGLVPRSAEATEPGAPTGPLTHRLRALAVTYQRRFVDSATGGASDAGKLDLRVAPTQSSTWLLTSAWREIQGRDDMQNARAWTESVTVADTALAPVSRVVHVQPYRRWAGISIDQRFRSDSVVGLMSLDEDPTRRPIARDLRAERDRLIASDALGPVYFMGVSLAPGAEFDVSFLGWAVVPNDVIVRMRMRVTGSERIETPAGSFDCWRFVIRVNGDTHYHWVRKSDHLGVRTLRRMRDGRTRELILIHEESTR